MAYIELLTDDATEGPAGALFAAERERTGAVANYARLFAHKPAVYTAWRQLLGAPLEGMDLRRYELATLSAARALRSTYCGLAHGTVLSERFYDADTVRRLARDAKPAGLDDADLAIMDFAEKVARDASSVAQDDVDRLRGHGLSDGEIFEVALTAALRSFFSKSVDAFAVQPDDAYAALEPGLREELTFGRTRVWDRPPPE